MRSIYFLLLILLTNSAFADWINLNTGIDDDLTGVVFWNENGVVSGKRGLYYTTNGGDGPSSWTRFNITNNEADSLIYNQTQFYHCFTDPQNGGYNVFACGRDTVNSTAIVMKITFPEMDYSIIYQGPENSSLNRIDYSQSNDEYYAVGDNGLIVRFDNTAGYLVENSLEYDLLSIHFYYSKFWIGADGVKIIGSSWDDDFVYTVEPAEGHIYKDVVYKSDNYSYATGNGYFCGNYDEITEYSNYDYGPLNGRCILHKYNINLIGTDHGIFRTNENYTILEWQPSSLDYTINELWRRDLTQLDTYACGDNGIVLYGSDLGGPSKPYVRMNCRGGCTDSESYLLAETGSATDCVWYIDGVYSHSGCDASSQYFGEAGVYTIDLVTYSEGSLDTTSQDVNIVDKPEINKPVTVLNSSLCREGAVEVTLDSSQLDVFYIFREFGEYDDYGSSQNGNNSSITFSSDTISNSTDFRLRAYSSIARCYNDFTDTIAIKVEKTRASYRASKINIVPDEDIKFHHTCNDADNFKWTFSSNGEDSVSYLENPIISYSEAGNTTVDLVCWSDIECYDSIQGNGPTVYEEPIIEDSCWTNINNGTDPDWSGYYTPDISQLTQSESGYFTCGYFSEEAFATQHGESLDIPNIAGGYMLKHDHNGVLKWFVHSHEKTITRENIRSVAEDDFGNVYICGTARGYFIDNRGDSIDISNNGHRNYIIKMDSLGGVLWYLTSNYYYPTKLSIDKSNNLIVAASLTTEGEIPIALNGVVVDAIGQENNNCNYSVAKISPDGSLIWDFGILINDVNGSEITKIGCDEFNNLYITGVFEIQVDLFSVDSTYAHSFYCNPENYDRTLFLAKYDSTGVFQWKVKSISSDIEYAGTIPMDMVTDSMGNCYISGNNRCYYVGLEQIFENTDGSVTSISAGEYFIAKVNSEGICEWIQGAKYSYYGYGHCIAKNGDEISVLGQISNNDQSPQTSEFTSSDNSTFTLTISKGDYFIAVYDTEGNLLRLFTNGDNNGVNNYYHGFNGLFITEDGSYYSARNMKYDYLSSDYMNFGTNINSTNGNKI